MTHPYSEAQEAITERIGGGLSYANIEEDGNIYLEGSFSLRELQFIVNTLEHATEDLFK